IRRRRWHGLAAAMIDKPVTLSRPVDAIGPMQAGVEPLRRIGRANLSCEHVGQLVVEDVRIRLAVEMPALPAPVGPGAGETMEHLLGGALAEAGGAAWLGHAAPQPGGNI